MSARAVLVVLAWGVAAGSVSALDAKGSVKPYDSVITKDAVSDPGLFIVHRIGDKIFYEIPPSALGKDMLWVEQISKTRSGYSYGGMPVLDRVVRWELRRETILLRDVKYALRAQAGDSIDLAVEATSVPSIIRTFPVRAWGKDKAAVIDVTGLFTSDVPEFSARRQLKASGMDPRRTFLEGVRSFPSNIEVKVLATYSVGGGGSGGTLSALLHHSMVKLPERPMRPRRRDGRVGFFSVAFENFGDGALQEVEQVQYIARWRLEKKDPNAAVSEPKKPIVFYIGREVPEKWKPWVKKGIEAWRPAFEKAGFRNAIVAKYAPSPHEDPDWDAEDARISTIRWLPSTTENAFGPHVHDPRTGEILEADVRIYHNVLKLARDWYFVQASACDPRARKLPLPDDLMGELLAFIVTHEVGHTLGLPHNMKASSAFSVKQLRDAKFTKKNGTSPSIMDYARFNYIAQPGDGATLIPVVGPYDFFSIEWGYRQFKKGENEKAKLEEIARRQIDDPMLRFGDLDPDEDPTRQREDLSSDPVAAARLGTRNIRRIAGYLVQATCARGKDYSQLRNMYQKLLEQWSRELGHVVGVAGGVEQRNLFFGDVEAVYFPVPAGRQREAVRFLANEAFQPPPEILSTDITRRLEADGAPRTVRSLLETHLRRLLSSRRLLRMQEVAETETGDVYTPRDLLADVRHGLWTSQKQSSIRRGLQRAHVDILGRLLSASGRGSDPSALARVELKAVLSLLQTAPAADGALERAHRADMRARIRKLLGIEGKSAQPRPGAAARV